VATGCRQRIQVSVGVDGEVGHRIRGGPIVGGLCGGVDDNRQIPGMPCEHAIDSIGVADVQRERVKGVVTLIERVGEGLSRGSRPEELGAHVVVEADHVVALADEV
jgi:hypothetical protein